MRLAQRLIKIIEHHVGSQRRYKDLEDMSGIGVSSWRQVWNERQRPTAEMIEAVAQQWPQYAFWMTTGITDPERGHIAPSSIDSYYPVVKGIEQSFATDEFKFLINQLKNEPKSISEIELRKRELEDHVLNSRESKISAKNYVLYEKAIRALGETGRSEFFTLESMHALVNIRKLRCKEESNICFPIQEWRSVIFVENSTV